VEFECYCSAAFPQTYLGTPARMATGMQSMEHQSHGMMPYGQVCTTLSINPTTSLHATATHLLPTV
jgi:hypothetical protein